MRRVSVSDHQTEDSSFLTHGPRESWLLRVEALQAGQAAGAILEHAPGEIRSQCHAQWASWDTVGFPGSRHACDFLGPMSAIGRKADDRRASREVLRWSRSRKQGVPAASHEARGAAGKAPSRSGLQLESATPFTGIMDGSRTDFAPEPTRIVLPDTESLRQMPRLHTRSRSWSMALRARRLPSSDIFSPHYSL